MDFCRKVMKALMTGHATLTEPKPAGKPITSYQQERLAIQRQNANVRLARELASIKKDATLPPAYRQVINAKLCVILTGEQLIPLPRSPKFYTAREVGEIVGVSAQMIGRTSNRLGLKAPQGGENSSGQWVWTKAEHCDKQVDTWVYSEEGLARLRAAFAQEALPCHN